MQHFEHGQRAKWNCSKENFRKESVFDSGYFLPYVKTLHQVPTASSIDQNIKTVMVPR